MNVLGALVAAGLLYAAYSIYRTNKAMASAIDERKRRLLDALWAQIQQNGGTRETARVVERLRRLQDGHGPKQQA
jgi:hypothetical protein